MILLEESKRVARRKGRSSTHVNETAKLQERTLAMNEALILGSVRQHELTETAHASNDKLHAEIRERKQVEAALRESEKRYRTLFDLGPGAVYSCDASGVIQNFNRHAAELWGCEPVPRTAKTRARGFSQWVRPDGSSMPQEQRLMAKVLSGKMAEARDVEVLIERPDGTRVTVVVNIRPLKNEHGEITGAINCFYDITERKQAEAAQRRMAVLAATNRKLELEIAQRRVAEKALKASEQHQRWLLEDSHAMRDQLRRLSRQLLAAQEEERKRISRELHDVIAQTLTGINLRLANLRADTTNNPKDRDANLARTQQLVEQSVAIVHQFARELRPTVLDDLGLIPALHSFIKEFKEETGIQVSLSAFAGVEQVADAKRTALYRVAQEALTNVARHAHASRVDVSIQKIDDAVCLKIKDNGKGFSAGNAGHGKRSNRLGLLGMKERLEMVRGSFTIESVLGKGTTVTAQIPLGKTHAGTEGDAARI